MDNFTLSMIKNFKTLYFLSQKKDLSKWREKQMNYMIKYTAYFGSVQRLHRISTRMICAGPNLVD
ncbi:hypothetical protein [Maledivibacter halophilus]|nr:hypothetical protein [Maledivibacter halophilus]